MAYKKRVRDVIYRAYFQETNMPLSELLNWKLSKLSIMFSSSRTSINTAIRLKRKKKGQWVFKDYKNALSATSFLRRAKKLKAGVKGKGGYSKGEITLKNWGYDVKKK